MVVGSLFADANNGNNSRPRLMRKRQRPSQYDGGSNEIDAKFMNRRYFRSISFIDDSNSDNSTCDHFHQNQQQHHTSNNSNDNRRRNLQQQQQQICSNIYDADITVKRFSTHRYEYLPKVTRRQCALHASQLLRQLIVFRMALPVLFLTATMLSVVVNGSSPTYSLCYTQLIRADTNGDQIIDISTDEWGFVVQYISGGTSTAGALDAAALLTTAGSTDATTFNIATVQDISNSHAFCQALYAAIITASSIQLDVTENKCFYAATIGDANRDSSLERFAEFPRYANQISGNSYGFGTTYEELPAIVQSVFDEFVDDATAGTINIVGSKSSESVTTEQATKLNALCQSAAIAILAANGDVSTTPVAVPVSTPVDVPVPVAAPILAPVADVAPVAASAPVAQNTNSNVNIPDDYVESFTVTDCLLKIAFSDASRDNTLNNDEYYDFLNRVTDDSFAEYSSFEALPETLRTNFISLAGGTADGTIDVMGSKPGQTPTQEDTDRLNEFCKLTDVAIQSAVDGDASGGASPPVAAPVANTGSAPVASNISFDDCVKSMIIADISRNSLLDGKEFVRFMSRLDTNVSPTDELIALPPTIQMLFTTLATSGGEIDVTGSKPNETPTPEQKANLESICNQVGTALSESGSVPNPTPSSGSVTINNSFITANTKQVTASMLVPGQPDWDALNKAYATFIEASVSDLTTNRIRRLNIRNMRHRYLTVTGVMKESPQLGQITETPCPVDVTIKESVCQLISASFAAEFNDMDESVVFSTLTNNTQAQIIPRLNDTLFSVNPSTAIYIVGPSDISLPNDSATKPPKKTIVEEGGDSNGTNVVQIIGALVIVGILFGGPVYYWKTRRRSKRKPYTIDDAKHENVEIVDDEEVGRESAPSIRVKSTFTDEEESEEEDPGIDEDASSANDDADGDDDAPNRTDQNDKIGGKKFNAFRLGKKKGSISDDDIGILDSNDGLAPGTEDFDDYEFDEPSELFVGNNTDTAWGDSNWGMATSTAITNNSNHIGFMADDSSPKNIDEVNENEHTEWSRSQSSGSNSAFETSSVVSGASGDNVAQLGGLVDKGQWGGVLQTAAQFHNNLNDSISSRDSDHGSFSSKKSDTETSHYDDNPEELKDDLSDDRTPMTNISATSEELRRTEMYRLQIEDLVRKTAPDEIGNVQSMMKKFVGREAELINTLQTMYDRLISQRSLKAVHKSKAIRARDMRDFASGGAESSAVIAAACMINTEDDALDYNQGDFDYENEGSYYGDGDPEERSGSGSRSYGNDENENYSYDEENDQSQSGTYDDDEENRSGRYDDDNNDAYDDYDDENGSGRYDDDDDDYDDDDEDRSGTGSYDADGKVGSHGGSSVKDDHDPTDYGYDDNVNTNVEEDDHSRASEYDDDENDDFDEFGSPKHRVSNFDDEYDDDDDDAFGDEGERFDDEEFDDDFIGSASGTGSHTGSYEVKEGSTFASHSGSGSKSHSHSFVYDDGDGSYYSDEEPDR